MTRFLWIAAFGLGVCAHPGAAQTSGPSFHVDVDMVVLSFTVNDSRGRYVKDLTASDFRIVEDGITQRIKTFSAGRSRNGLSDGGTALVNSSVFVLVDTSNAMYETYPQAQDAIAGFIRSLPDGDSVAVYTFNRNLYKAVDLTNDRHQALAGLRSAALGENTALYNALLLTIRDAEKLPGNRTIVVFSNGPDDASIIGPDDVSRLAEEAGIPIYVVSTQEENPISLVAFQRLTKRTGGELYIARDWAKQESAFASIIDRWNNAYTVTYYPENTNTGFRKIDVEIIPDPAKKYRVHARPGYRPMMTVSQTRRGG